jgi:Rrf2 family protein
MKNALCGWPARKDASSFMNSRFSIAVHILTLLASMPDERLTSEFMALSIGTNAVVIRRQLALLRRAGLVDSKGSKGGGWRLARPADQIGLSEIHSALGTEVQLRMHRNHPHPACAVGQNVRTALQTVYAEVDAAIDETLSGHTVQEMLNDVLRLKKQSVRRLRP